MNRLFFSVRTASLIFIFGLMGSVTSVHAEDDLGLCPSGFSQETVRTGSVDCFRSTSARSDRSDAEQLRLQREAVCLATPNAEVTSSIIRTNSSGRFFAEIICTVARPVPAGTVLCPDDSEEVVRAFDTLVCKYFGSSVLSMQEGQAVLTSQTSECTNGFGGRVLKSGIDQQTFEGVSFFTTFLSCAREIQDTDIIQCPYTFFEVGRDENIIDCRIDNTNFDSINEAQEANAAEQAICTGTTAGLGSVSSSVVGATTSNTFRSTTECEIRIARYSDFADSAVIRACDASCTEEIEQSRTCLNGGQIGSTGCTAPSTQVIVRRCNTGPDRDGLCPVMATPAANVVPLLLLEED